MTCLLAGGELVRATRVYEGVEDDHYRCERGHTPGVDWARGPATERQWPPTDELVELAERVRRSLR
jgi:hypothetical protein